MLGDQTIALAASESGRTFEIRDPSSSDVMGLVASHANRLMGRAESCSVQSKQGLQSMLQGSEGGRTHAFRPAREGRHAVAVVYRRESMDIHCS